MRIKRVYEPPSAADGRRILVERLWPRGLTKQKARVDWWLKEAAPTSALRQWFGHDPGKWREFQRRYTAELKANPHALQQLRAAAVAGRVTLVFAARDARRNSAVVLRRLLERCQTPGDRHREMRKLGV